MSYLFNLAQARFIAQELYDSLCKTCWDRNITFISRYCKQVKDLCRDQTETTDSKFPRPKTRLWDIKSLSIEKSQDKDWVLRPYNPVSGPIRLWHPPELAAVALALKRVIHRCRWKVKLYYCHQGIVRRLGKGIAPSPLALGQSYLLPRCYDTLMCNNNAGPQWRPVANGHSWEYASIQYTS